MFAPLVLLTASMALYISPVTGLAEETVGDKFRKVIADINSRCKRERRGPYLDRNDPEYRKKVADTSCDVLTLQPRDWRTEPLADAPGQSYPIPARWLTTSEGRFAHSIRLPKSTDKAKSTYRLNLRGEDYFLALCKAEAGEFLLEVTTGVKGFRIDRPNTRLPRGYRDLLFHTNEWSLLSVVRPENFLSEGRYDFVEFRRSADEVTNKQAEFVRIDRTIPQKPDQTINGPPPAYLVTWRGIRRPNDWEHGIYGQEIIVLEAASMRVLAFKRSFIRYEPFGTGDPRDVLSRPCPADAEESHSSAQKFIRKALVPSARR